MKHLENWYKTIKRKTQDQITNIRENHLIRQYCENNVIFLTFVITCLINSTLLRFLTMHTIENYLYGLFGESRKVYNIFNYYMSGKNQYAKLKMFWMLLDY